MKTKIRRGAQAIILAAALMAAAAGCEKEMTNGPEAPKAPALPPSASMEIDLSAFSLNELGPAPKSEFKFNFWNAQLRAAYVNLAVAAVVLPPAAAISAAVHSIPSPQPDGSWIWTYTYVNGEEEIILRLRGLPQGDSALWQMTVTALHEDPPLDRALWFEGTTRRDDEGEWTLHDISRPGNPAVLHIDWELERDNGGTLVFECIDPASPDYDDRLTYSVAGALGSIVVFDASESAEWDIRWDGATGTGSLKVPDYNGGNRACWDEHQEDVACPAS